MDVERFCPRCNTNTLWGDDPAPGTGVNYCLNETDHGPCLFRLGDEMNGVEQFNFDRHVGHVQREHVHETPRRFVQRRWSLT